MQAKMLEKNPTHGFLTGVIDKDFLEYQCGLREENKLSCTFDQIHVTPKKAGFDKKREEAALTEFRTKMADDCRRALDASSSIDEKLKSLSEGERADASTIRDAFTRACKNPNDGNILGFVQALNAQESATCTISLNHFEQLFEVSLSGTWTAVTAPGGICGRMFVASFEPIDGILWKYKTRSINTVKYPNTDNKFLDICNGADEKEYEFTTKEAVFKNCRYIGWW
ncbi:MAG: hypothetical protein ACLP7P_03020 [Rhodomicrobium sp.]